MSRAKSCTVVLLLVSFVLVGGDIHVRADWPSFRGPFGDGHASTNGNTLKALPLNWSETNNIQWKTAIHDRGWSTPVIMGGQIWMTTATEEGHDFFAVCVDEASGRILHDEKLFHSEHPEPLGNDVNSYATPSPVIEAGRVYVNFGSYGTACLDTVTGKEIWRREDLPCKHFRGPSSSVILFENLLILTFDGVDQEYVTALEKSSGKTVWRTDRSAVWNDAGVRMSGPGDQRKAHSTPFIALVAGQPQMFSEGAKAAYAYDPRTGRELWKIHHGDYSVAPMPLFDGKLAYLTTGRNKTELLAVKPDGAGDVTESNIVWRLGSHIGKSASPILVDGLIYTVSDESFLSCVDAAAGQVVWTERIGGGYQASPIYADGKLYFCDTAGKVTVVKPGREYQPLATNMLADGCMSSPAVSDGALFLRTRTHLYRVEAAKPAVAAAP